MVDGMRLLGNCRVVSKEGYDMLVRKLTLLVCLVFMVSSCNRTTGDITFGGIKTVTKNPLEIVQVYAAEQELGGIKKDLKSNADAHCKDFDKTASLKTEEFILRGQTKFVVYSCK